MIFKGDLHSSNPPSLKVGGCTFGVYQVVREVSIIWKLRGHLFWSGHLIFQGALDSHKGNALYWI